MMKRNPWFVLLFVGFLFAASVSLVFGLSILAGRDSDTPKKGSKHNLLVMDIKGIIFDSEKFLKKLRKYEDDDSIKGLLIRINSPGGAVGPSEEIYRELKQYKEKTKNPIVVYSPSLNASGGYYISMASDKIVVTNGTLIGSIGVIMEFANLEKLYDWAKIQRFSITSGKFKDSGSEYRPMKEEEKAYFQGLISDTYQQFRAAVKETRKLEDAILDEYADGRVLNGEQAVKLGFADEVGSYADAGKVLAKLAGVEKSYELFEVPKHQPSLLERLIEGEDDEDSEWSLSPQKKILNLIKQKGFNRPMAIMPGFWLDEVME